MNNTSRIRVAYFQIDVEGLTALHYAAEVRFCSCRTPTLSFDGGAHLFATTGEQDCNVREIELLLRAGADWRVRGHRLAVDPIDEDAGLVRAPPSTIDD